MIFLVPDPPATHGAYTRAMTHEEAVARCRELNREQTDGRHWLPRQVDASRWEVVSISGPGLRPRGPLKEGAESRPSPSDPPDPRPSIFRNIPPYGAGF
jgi:hypothetical protein